MNRQEIEEKKLGCLWRDNPVDDGESQLSDCGEIVWDIDPSCFNYCPFCGKKLLM